MGDANENLGVGGGQPPQSPLGGPSLDAEEKAMRKGKGRMLAGMIAAVVIAVVLAIFFMASGGEAEAYRNFGRNINGLKQSHFDQFWGCALRGVNIADINNNEALQSQIHIRSLQGGGRYAERIEEECLPKLQELRPKLDALIPPEGMQPQVTELAEATSALRSAWSNYSAYLKSDEGYAEETAQEPVTNIARAWYDFKRVHSQINRGIREQLGEAAM